MKSSIIVAGIAIAAFTLISCGIINYGFPYIDARYEDPFIIFLRTGAEVLAVLATVMGAVIFGSLLAPGRIWHFARISGFMIFLCTICIVWPWCAYTRFFQKETFMAIIDTVTGTIKYRFLPISLSENKGDLMFYFPFVAAGMLSAIVGLVSNRNCQKGTAYAASISHAV